MTAADTHRSLEELVAYELGELDEAAAAAVEEHYFACDLCTARLEAMQQLGAGVAGLVRAGQFEGPVTLRALEAATARGLQVRTYALAPGGSVQCTAAPDDDLVALRLDLGEAGAELEAVDGDLEMHILADGSRHREQHAGLVVDRSAGALVLLYGGDRIRALPRTQWSIQVRRPGEEQAMTDFLLDHTPWDDLPPERRG